MPTHERTAKQRAKTLKAAQARSLTKIERLVWACFELDATIDTVAVGLRTTKELDLAVFVTATFTTRQPTDLNPAVEALKRALRTTQRSDAMILFDFRGDRTFCRADFRQTEM